MKHIPVLIRESIDGLEIKSDGIYIDGTFGRGGHSIEIAKRLTSGKLLSIDCDHEAVREAEKLFVAYKSKVTCKRGNFRDIAKILEGEGIKAVDGMVFDLGASSPQLDDRERGFSYMHDSKLDMRMDRGNRLTASEIVNNYKEEELSKIFFDYGEERYSKKIARNIVKKRIESPINTTFELNEIIISSIPAAARRESQHPSKRCFQALRIEVGDELGALEKMLETAPLLLRSGGRLCVISFHSLEDRIVKNAFTEYAKGCTCPKGFPVCICKKTPYMKLITRRPITADSSEVELNPRARSAKLRIAERI